MPEGFHFQHPGWFWLLPVLLVLWWRLRQPAAHDNPWRRVCDARLLPYLLVDAGGRGARLPAWLLAIAWLLALGALADPVWDRQPQPVYRSQEARVVVLDLSRSMLAADLPPSRLVRARYKVADILDLKPDGQTGLVVFAGDAFAVAPLSNDADTIRALLQPLEPALMPVRGSRVDLALRLAGDLLRQAGASRGEVVLITDGYHDGRAIEAAQALSAAGYRLSVLGTGTAAGAPLPDGQGGYLHDAGGDIVLPKLDSDALRELAAAGGGRYATISGDTRDIRYLLADNPVTTGTGSESTGLTTTAWQSRGPWLALLLLPFAALVFRRGWLLSALLAVGISLGTPQPAMALDWDDLWLRPDQQAARALRDGAPGHAAQLAQDPGLRGTAAYRAGAYEQALAEFARAGGADGEYNRGNALARLGRYDAAIDAYERALAAQPGMEDAAYNKAQLEKLLQQRAQQQNPQSGDGETEAEQPPQNPAQGDREQAGEAQSQNPVQNGQPQDRAENGQGQDTAQRDGSQGATRDQGKAAESAGVAAANDRQTDAGNPDTPPVAEPPADDAAQPDRTRRQSAHDAAAARREAAAREPSAPGTEQDAPAGAHVQSDPLDSEERQAAEQWLRRIPDDPGGLLRRKFLYQYRQRAASGTDGGGQPW